MTTEIERATQFRKDLQAREDARLAREKALRGDPVARQANLDAWSPLRRWPGWDPLPKVDEEAAEARRQQLRPLPGGDDTPWAS